MQSAVRLLREEGASAVSTTRLTTDVGIVQSGFYSHFTSLEECLAEATSRVVDEIREPVRAWMDELRRDVPAAEELVIERLTDHFVRVLDMLAPRWHFLQLLERHRGSPGTLGVAMSAVHEELVGDVRSYLRALFAQENIPSKGLKPRIEVLAFLIVEMVTTATEAVDANRRLDRRIVAETLAVGVNRMVASAMETARVGPAPG